MSNKNNVNPDHYKVAGRDRQGETVVHDQQRQSMARGEARLLRRKKTPPTAARKQRPTGDGKEEGDDR
jgi:hypothetical protein